MDITDLTEDQRIALGLVAEEGAGEWAPGSGVRLRSDAHMASVLDSLIPLGLVARLGRGRYGLTGAASKLLS
jgi:hypothetical protein